jgi:hypothetical protein
MRTFSASYVPGVLFATPALGRAAMATAWRWRRLLALLFDPYRPEQHYMRGPGPKWREKQVRRRGSACALSASWETVKPPITKPSAAQPADLPKAAAAE